MQSANDDKMSHTKDDNGNDAVHMREDNDSETVHKTNDNANKISTQKMVFDPRLNSGICNTHVVGLHSLIYRPSNCSQISSRNASFVVNIFNLIEA